jgi:hypothetical protein
MVNAGVGGCREESIPFLTALAFSAFRCACAGFMDFSFGIAVVVLCLFPGRRYIYTRLSYPSASYTIVGAVGKESSL